MRSEDVETQYEPLRWYEKIPVVNLVYEVLFDEAPTFGALDKTLNLFGLVDALLLTIVMAIPMSFDYEELVELNERYTAGGYNKFFRGIGNYWGHQPEDFDGMKGYYSNRLNFATANAINFLSVSFISVLILYVVMSNSNLCDDQSTKQWWKYVRWLVLGQLTCTLIGFSQAYSSIYIMVECKFPNYYYDRGEENWDIEAANLFHYNFQSFMIANWTAAATTLVIAGLGATNKYWFKKHPNSPDSLIGMGIMLPWEKHKTRDTSICTGPGEQLK